MAKKSGKVVSKEQTEKLVTVIWPIIEHSKSDIRSTVLGVLDLIRSQLDNNSVTIFNIMHGNAELNNLVINHSIYSVTLNYFRDMDRNTMRIIFRIPVNDSEDLKKK